MAFDLENPLGEGSDAELLVFWRAYLAGLPTFGTTRIVNGRTWVGPSATEALKIIEALQATVDVAAGEGSATNYAKRLRAS